MTINADTLANIVEDREEQIAARETLYDAMTEARSIARAALMPNENQDEALTRIVALTDATRKRLSDMLNAAQKSGPHYERLDAEAMQWFEATDRQFHMLSPEGKRRYVACRKREAARQSRNGGQSAGKAVMDNRQGEVSVAPARSLSILKD